MTKRCDEWSFMATEFKHSKCLNLMSTTVTGNLYRKTAALSRWQYQLSVSFIHGVKMLKLQKSPSLCFIFTGDPSHCSTVSAFNNSHLTKPLLDLFIKKKKENFHKPHFRSYHVASPCLVCHGAQNRHYVIVLVKLRNAYLHCLQGF